MTTHTRQIASTLHRAVQQILNEGLHDPRVRGLLSVTGVEVSDDLADATVRVSVIPAKQGPLSIRGLQHAAAHVRSRLTRQVQMRRVPRLHFQLDESLKRQAEVLAAIQENRPDDAPDDHATAPSATPQDLGPEPGVPGDSPGDAPAQRPPTADSVPPAPPSFPEEEIDP